MSDPQVLTKRYTNRFDMLSNNALIDGKDNSQAILTELVRLHRTLFQACLNIESLANEHVEALKQTDSDIFPMRYFLSLTSGLCNCRATHPANDDADAAQDFDADQFSASVDANWRPQ